VALHESLWVHPIVEPAHVLALCLFFGLTVELDRRLLGVAFRGVRVSDAVERDSSSDRRGRNDTITARRTMNRFTLIFLLAAAPAGFAADDWISLFNGKDFTGWKVGGDQNTFQVKDGALVANGQVAHAFYDGPVNNHDFKNFELMVDVMTAPNSNGGVYFHTEFQDRGFPRKGFEVQVNNTHRDPVKTGSLYHVKDVGIDDIKEIVKDNEWFTEYIVVRDNTVSIKLNGKEVVNWTQPADWNGGREGPGRVLSHGTIALQGHDPNSTVYYKNIRIKPLP
jgi:hypothetical protein